MSKVKQQHYVPRFYLRLFSEDGTSLFVFDKQNGRSFHTNVRNISAEKYFYDFPELTTSELEELEPELRKHTKSLEEYTLLRGLIQDPQTVEKALSELEANTSEYLSKVLEDASNLGGIDPGVRLSLAYYIAIQSLRTREAREQISEGIEALSNELLKAWPGNAQYTAKANERFVSLQHISSTFDPDLLNQMITLMDSYIWTIGKNTTARPLYTSDHPVVRCGNIRKHHQTYEIGFASPGVEIFFPLSSTYILMIRERNYFRDKCEHLDNAVVRISADEVFFYNRLQLAWSYRQVYCERRDFSLARRFCKEHPTQCAERAKMIHGIAPLLNQDQEEGEVIYTVSMDPSAEWDYERPMQVFERQPIMASYSLIEDGFQPIYKRKLRQRIWTYIVVDLTVLVAIIVAQVIYHLGLSLILILSIVVIGISLTVFAYTAKRSLLQLRQNWRW